MKHLLITMLFIIGIDMEDRPGNTELITVTYSNGVQDKFLMPRQDIGKQKILDFIVNKTSERLNR